MADMVQSIVVVGAAGDIGGVIAKRLVNENYRVVAVGRSQEALAKLAAAIPGIVGCTADMGADDSIAAIAQAVHGTQVRAVVHSPGLSVAGGALDAPPASLGEAVNIKCGGMLRLVRGVDAGLQPHSRLIAIGGHYGLEPSAYAAAPGVANAALLNLVRQLSWAYGPRGITAHLIAPGPVETDRLTRVAENRARLRGVGVSEILNDMRQESALHVFTTAEQIAWGVSMLLAPEADALAGSSLLMDAGRRKGLP